MVYVIAIGATLVLISTLINFILFVVNQDAFRNWCVQDSRMTTLRNIQNQSGGNTTITLGSDIDYYNCDRLFANQVKWSLLCVIAMYIIYVSQYYPNNSNDYIDHLINDLIYLFLMSNYI